MSGDDQLVIPVADPPPRTTIARLLRAMWRQKSKTPRCPRSPRLDRQLALVTGGNGGIGFETYNHQAFHRRLYRAFWLQRH